MDRIIRAHYVATVGDFASRLPLTVFATAILDRVLHHAITINIRGNSYRVKEKLKAGLIRAEEPATAIN